MRSNLLSGLVGGVVAAAIGAILITAGVVDVGDRQVVERQPALAQPEAEAEAGDGGLTVRDIAEKAGPGVALIEARIPEAAANPFGFPEQERGQASGTAFVLNEEGYLATNAHVVDRGRNVQVTFNRDDGPVSAKIVGSDLSTDLAVVKVDPSKADLKPVPLGDSSKVRVGDPVVAIGNPFGYDHTVTSGIVSAIGRQLQAPNDFSIGDAIQTDAAINPGNSGGPLLDASGRVIGINSQIATGGGSRGFVGIGFAVPVNLAKEVLPQLIEDGEVKHAYIGITTAPVTGDVARALDLPADAGALIQDVQSGSPAAKAGLRAGREQHASGIVAGGDLIVGVDGREVTSPDDIAAAIADNKPGDRIEIRFFRGSTQRTATVTLGERPDQAPSTRPGSP